MGRLPKFFLVIIAPLLAICLALLGLAAIPINPLGWFLLMVGIVYSAGTAIFTVVRREHFWEAQAGSETIREERGDRSFWLISLTMMAVFYLSPLEYLYTSASLPRSGVMAYSGVGLVGVGSALFIWARRTLGVHYSGHVSVGRDQELVQSGPYRLIRHPAYSGYLLIALGISLGFSSLSGLVSTLLLLLPCLVYRIDVEEKMLSEHFGEAYHRYASQVKRLIPCIW